MDEAASVGGGLLGPILAFIDARKRGLLNNIQNPGLLGTRTAEDLGQWGRTMAQDSNAMASVMPSMQASGQEGMTNNALNMGGLLGMMKLYRGTAPGAVDRIATGSPEWDQHLFAATTPEQARLYGSSVQELTLKDSAKVLREGSKEFRAIVGALRKDENLVDYGTRATAAAKAVGYDAVNFDKWKDLGVAIINRDAIK